MTWRPPYRGDSLQASRDRVSLAWKKAGWKYARGLGRFATRASGFAGAAAAAGLGNLFAEVPRFSSDPRVNMPRPMEVGFKRPNDNLLPAYRAPRARRSNEQDAGGYIQTKYTKDRVGKKLDKAQRIMKLLASQVTYKVDRFGALSQTTDNESFYQLNSYLDGTAPNRYTFLPVYAMNLTCVNQKDSLPATGNIPSPFQRLVFWENGDQFRWSPIAGLLAGSRDATPLLTYNYEPMTQPVASSVGGEPFDNTYQAFVGKVKIGMVITGARKFATTVWVQIVQFTDENLGPPLLASAVLGGSATPANPTALETLSTDGNDLATHKKFWLDQTNGLLENPLADRTVGRQPGMRVLYSKRFNYNPTLTTESDAGGHETVFKLNYNMDKVVNYMQKPDTGDIVDIDLASVNAKDISQGNTSLYPDTHKKGRVYLLIKAAVPAVAPVFPSVANYDNYPTFDLSVQRTIHRLRGEPITV